MTLREKAWFVVVDSKNDHDCADRIAAFAREIRNEALEEAATKLESFGPMWNVVAKIIRTLKDEKK